MTRIARPCRRCRAIITTGPYCPRCKPIAARARRNPVYDDPRHRKRAREMIAAHVEQFGATCPGWGDVGPHGVELPNILTADHVVPLTLGGDPFGPMTVACRKCNGRRGSKSSR